MLQSLIFIAVIAVLFIIRYPAYLNADALLNADEAFMANAILGVFSGEPLFLYYEGAEYHGVIGGLTAIPFLWLLGVNAFSYKLPALLYYALYSWTTYLIAKEFEPRAAPTALLLMLFPPITGFSLTLKNFPHITVSFLGSLIFLLFLRMRSKADVNGWNLFCLFAVIGLSIYSYTLSIMHIASILVVTLLSHSMWGVFRAQCSMSALKGYFKIAGFEKMLFVRLLDLAIVLFIPVIVFSYVFGGFGFDVFGVTIFQAHKLHKPVLQALGLIVLRILFHRSDITQFARRVNDIFRDLSIQNKRFLCWGLTGFVVGISPRIFSIFIGESTRGGTGFDAEFSPVIILGNLYDLVTRVFPETLGLYESFKSVLSGDGSAGLTEGVLFLAALAILFLYIGAIRDIYSPRWNDLKRMFTGQSLIYNPYQVFLIFPVLLCLGVLLSIKGPLYRYLFPLLGVLNIWLAMYLFKIQQRSIPVFVLLLVLICSFNLFMTYKYYLEQKIIDGVSIAKLKEPMYEVNEFLHSRKIQVAYADYGSATKATFLSRGSLLVNEHFRASRGKRMREKTASVFPFATIATGGIEENVYKKYLEENQIGYHSAMFEGYVVFYDFEGDRGKIDQLRSLFE